LQRGRKIRESGGSGGGGGGTAKMGGVPRATRHEPCAMWMPHSEGCAIWRAEFH